MSATSKHPEPQKTQETQPVEKTDSTVEVLYQKLGDKWYAFSIIGDEVFFGPIPPELQKPLT